MPLLPRRFPSFQLEQMPHLGLLRSKIVDVMGVGRRTDGYLLNDFEFVALQAHDLAGIVREKPDLAHPEVDENLGSETVVTQVNGKAEFLVCLHGIEPFLLKLVGVNLGPKADAAALLSHVDENSRSGMLDLRQGLVQLRPAIAAFRGKDVAGQAFAMDA